MKQLLFLLLFPCLALAQYPGNGNQKITLGEQTTADGLVWRGVASIDTVTATSKITRANKQDTSAFLLLDTTTNLLWHYKIGSNAWTQAGGGDTSLIAYVNTYGTQTVNGAKTFTSELTATRFNPTANTATGTGMFLPAANTLGFSTNGTNKMTLNASGNLGLGVTPSVWFNSLNAFQIGAAHLFGQTTGTGTVSIGNNNYLNSSIAWIYQYNGKATRYVQYDGQHEWYTAGSGTAGDAISFTQAMTLDASGRLGIGTTSPQSGYRLHVVDSVYVGGNVSASAYTTRSDYDLKDEIQNISYGINEVMQMQPVKYTYKSNGSTQLGFIAQDLGVITPEVVSFEDKMSVYYNALIPILTKAIQEQNALIKALEQRLLILENK